MRVALCLSIAWVCERVYVFACDTCVHVRACVYALLVYVRVMLACVLLCVHVCIGGIVILGPGVECGCSRGTIAKGQAASEWYR